jgi:hypothetical protein
VVRSVPDGVSIFACDPRLRLVEEPLLQLVRGMRVSLKAVDGIFEHGNQEPEFTLLGRCLPVQGREEL